MFQRTFYSLKYKHLFFLRKEMVMKYEKNISREAVIIEKPISTIATGVEPRAT